MADAAVRGRIHGSRAHILCVAVPVTIVVVQLLLLLLLLDVAHYALVRVNVQQTCVHFTDVVIVARVDVQIVVGIVVAVGKLLLLLLLLLLRGLPHLERLEEMKELRLHQDGFCRKNDGEA